MERQDNMMTPHGASIDSALAEAHLPSLLMAVVHLTGDVGLLTPEWQARYSRSDESHEARAGGYTQAMADMLRARARAAIEAHLAGAPLPPQPSSDIIARMMNFVAGAEIPAHYMSFLMAQLGLTTSDAASQSSQAASAGMRVVIVGAGMSGLLAAIRLKQAGIDFTVIEKNADVGGTWLENIYPGCRVDVPSHLYTYSFELKNDLPQYFSPQPVLLDYFRQMAAKYDLRPHIQFNTTVEEAVFDETSSVWRLQLSHPDGRKALQADAMITAVGQLNRPYIPDIKGRDNFAGESFHSACWRRDIDLAGKRVAVVGTGASAYQFVPEIVPQVAHLTIFQRTPPWALPKPHYHSDVPAGKIWLLENVPFYDKWYRFYLFWTLTDGAIAALTSDPDWTGPADAIGAANQQFRGLLAQAMRGQVGDRPDLLAKIMPDYPAGGKRLLVDNGLWLGTMKRDNVDLITGPITEITPQGVVGSDGELHEADIIIYGTGFQASRFIWPMRIVGRNGREIQDAWQGDARAYLGITTPGFPNMFMIYGPNTNLVVNGSIILFSECAVRYILGCLELIAESGSPTLEVRRDVHDAYNARVDAANARMAWGVPQVSSWYKNATGRVSQNWPFPLVDYWNATISPQPNDFLMQPPAHGTRHVERKEPMTMGARSGSQR
jgi:4-hydroxyacetophenone monooxygenase